MAGPKKSTQIKRGVLFSVLGIAAVVILGGTYGGIQVYSHVLSNSAEEWQAKANDEELLAKIADANEIASEIAVLRTAAGAYESVRIEIDSSEQYSQNFTRDLVDQLISCETRVLSGEKTQVALVTALSYDGTTLSISAESSSSQYASFFVQSVSNLDIFDRVSYAGYTSNNGVYTYTVTATFPEYVPSTDEEAEEEASQ